MPTDDNPGGMPDDDDDLDVAGLKSALSVERAARRDAEKALKSANHRLKELGNADTELAKALEDASAANQRANDAETAYIRLEVATAKGLTPAQAKRLAGDSREDLEKDADELLEAFGGKPPADNEDPPPDDQDGGDNDDNDDGTPAPPGGRPRPSLQPGGGNPGGTPEPDVKAIVDSIPRSGLSG